MYLGDSAYLVGGDVERFTIVAEAGVAQVFLHLGQSISLRFDPFIRPVLCGWMSETIVL